MIARIQLIQKGYFYTIPLKIGQLMYNGATSCLKCNGASICITFNLV